VCVHSDEGYCGIVAMGIELASIRVNAVYAGVVDTNLCVLVWNAGTRKTDIF
jgi:hypothetical protein